MDEQKQEAELRQMQARLLSKETGVSEEQILELIDLIGTDCASLIPEIEALKKSGADGA
jgi:flagellar basal body P-ring protein FlgI